MAPRASDGEIQGSGERDRSGGGEGDMSMAGVDRGSAARGAAAGGKQTARWCLLIKV